MPASSPWTSATYSYSHTPEVFLVLPTQAPPTLVGHHEKDVQELGLLGLLVLLEAPKRIHRHHPPPQLLLCVRTGSRVFLCFLCFYKVSHLGQIGSP